MKRIISILLVMAMLVGILPVSVFAENSTPVQQDPDTGHPFTDVASDSWYNEYVQFVWEKGLFTGTSATEYSPESTLTRAMFVTVLGRMESIDQSAYSEKVFTDVEPESWYGPYVAWAVQVGITNGMSENEFAPDADVTREQMAAFTHRYLNNKGKTVEADELTYNDSEKISDYAIEAVGVCSAIGIFEGDNHGNFNPGNNATRAEAAAVFTRLHKYINSTGADVTEYCKVSFAFPDAMDDTLKDSITMEESVMVEKGTLVYTLPLPSAAGYIFGGWYRDSAMTQLIANEETVEGDMTLYPYMFASEAEDEVMHTPNFTAALDVSADDYYVTIAAKDEETLRSALFIHSVTEGNVRREPVITDNGDGTFKVVPEGGFIAGGTYQFKALDRIDENIPVEDYIRFVENGELLGASVQFYNITVAKAEYNDLRLDDEIKFISVDNVEDFSFDNTALVDLKLSEETVNAEGNNATGSFEYHGNDINVGDVIAIHDGVVDAKNPTAEHCEHVSYVRITGIDGNRYSYEIPSVEEVLFMPEVLPVPKDAEEGVTLNANEDSTYTLTLYNEYLDYTAYSNPAVSAKTDADVGDFIALYQGESMEKSTSADFYEIVALDEGDAVTKMTLTASSVEEIQNSLGLYEQDYLDLTLTEEEIEDLEAQISEQVNESGFADETAKYIGDMLAHSGNSYMPEGFDPDSVCINVLDEDGNVISDGTKALRGVEAEAGVYIYNVKMGKVDIETTISNSLQEITTIGGNIGKRAELSVRVPLEIQQILIGGTTQNPGEWNTVLSSLDLELTASFVQEFAINTRFSADEEWDTWFIFPYISEINVDIDLDVGTYTGVGVVVTMDTGAYDNAYDFDAFISAFDSTYDPGKIKIGSLAKTLEAMMDDPYKFFGAEGDSNSLLDDYREMMNDKLEYVKLLEVPIVNKKNFYITPNFKIVHIQLDIDAVVSAKASINIGASFEHLEVKRYSFRIKCIAGKASQNVTTLQNGYTNFNFYAMGNIGLRIGGRVTFKIGLFSVKIANLGLMVETGPCLQMYGFFYFHYDKRDGQEPHMYHGGMYLIELGWYLLFDFTGGVIMDTAGFNVHLVQKEWYFWRSGDGKFTVAPSTPTQDKNVGSGTQIGIRTSSAVGNVFRYATQVLEVDIRTGEKSVVNKNLDDFNIVCTNPAFVIDLEQMYVGKISVIPPEDPSIQSVEGQIRLTYKHGTVPMSKTPIVSVINLKWTKTYPYGYVYFEDENGNRLGESQTVVEGAHPTNLRYPSYTPPAGYDWEGQWQYYESGTNEDGSYYYGYNLFDPETYVMKDFEFLYLEPVLIPKSGIPYKVHHFIESLEKPDTYELYQTDEKTGTSGEFRFNYDTITIDGFQYNRDRSGGYYYYHPYYDMMMPQPPSNIVKGDGSLVIEYYYDRLFYDVRLYADSSQFYLYSDTDGTSSHKWLPYGSTIDESPFRDVEIPGYEFAGWRDDSNPDAELLATLPIVTGNVSYTAEWTPRNDTPYTVNHHIMNLDGEFEVVLTQTLTGTTEAIVDTQAIAAAAIAENPELFQAVTYRYADDRGIYYTSQEYEIKGAGYTEINLYYTREYHRAYWYGLGDVPTMSYFYKGQTITPPEQIPEAEAGYRFSHWKGLAEDPLMGSEDRYFTPVFEGVEGIPYTVIHVRANLENYCDVNNDFYIETETMYGKTGDAPTINYRTYEGFTAEPYEAGNTVIRADGSLTVVVKYKRNSYSLTLDANGGTLSQNRSIYYYGIDFTLPKATREGYTFVCWYLKGDPNETPVTYIDCYALTDLTYVVKWQADPINYNVEHYLQNLDGSYGEPRVIAQTGIIDAEVTAQTSEFVGFTFDEGNALNVTTGYISDTEGNIVDADGNPIVLKLYYTRNSYKATWYDYDGSKLAEADVLYGAEISLPKGMAQPSRTGYTFGGWNDFGTMGAKDAAFYAATDGAWNANTYTVSFDANGGEGTMTDQPFTYDKAQTLTPNSFTRDGYIFVGWSLSADGEVKYADQAQVTNLASSGKVILYAQWEAGTSTAYKVIYYGETPDGTGFEEIKTENRAGKTDTAVSATAINIEGFTYDVSNSNNVPSGIIAGDGSLVLKLYYTRNSYTLILDFNGDSMKQAVMDWSIGKTFITGFEVADQAVTMKYGQTLTEALAGITVPVMTEEGYKVWDEELGEYVEVPPVYEDMAFETAFPGYNFGTWDGICETMPAENLTLTAQWTPITITVTFYSGRSGYAPDVTGTPITKTYSYGDSIQIPDHDFVWSDHTITGWKIGDPSSGFGQYPDIVGMSIELVYGYYNSTVNFNEGDIMEVYPFWTSNSYLITVEFNGNGAESGTMESQPIDGLSGSSLVKNKFQREGYTFVGWNTAADGSGTFFADGEWISQYSVDVSSLILYAQWEKAD